MRAPSRSTLVRNNSSAPREPVVRSRGEAQIGRVMFLRDREGTAINPAGSGMIVMQIGQRQIEYRNFRWRDNTSAIIGIGRHDEG